MTFVLCDEQKSRKSMQTNEFARYKISHGDYLSFGKSGFLVDFNAKMCKNTELF